MFWACALQSFKLTGGLAWADGAESSATSSSAARIGGLGMADILDSLFTSVRGSLKMLFGRFQAALMRIIETAA